MGREAPGEFGVSSGDFVAIEGRDGARAVREYVRATTRGESASVDDVALTADHFEAALETVEPGGEGRSFDDVIGTVEAGMG